MKEIKATLHKTFSWQKCGCVYKIYELLNIKQDGHFLHEYYVILEDEEDKLSVHLGSSKIIDLLE